MKATYYFINYTTGLQVSGYWDRVFNLNRAEWTQVTYEVYKSYKAGDQPPAPAADVQSNGFWSELRALVIKYDDQPDKDNASLIGTSGDIDRAIPIERRYVDALRAVYNMAHHLEGVEAQLADVTASGDLFCRRCGVQYDIEDEYDDDHFDEGYDEDFEWYDTEEDGEI